MFGQDRNQLRQFYVTSWKKFQQKQVLSPLEALVADVIQLHPEYHPVIEGNQPVEEQEFTPESGQTNPYLHMGLHIALREQIQAGNPPEVARVYRQLSGRMDAHEAEHRMIDCLAETLWHAQRNQTLPDQPAFISCLEKLLQ